MTPGEKHTEDTALAALALLPPDDKQAVFAWLDDKERKAREDGATRAGLTGGLVIFLRAAGVGLVLTAGLLFAVWTSGLFDPCSACPQAPPCPVCEAPAPLAWQDYNMPAGVRYSRAPARCVAIDDVIMCAPDRTPTTTTPPGVSP